jgi:ADP-ribose pyrophosphatase
MIPMPDRILVETPFLRCIDRDGWFFAERPHIDGVVAVVALTTDRRIILVEQPRVPVGAQVIELPAGLAGDEPGASGEGLEGAAARELVEETGYRAGRLELLGRCPTSPGMVTEVLHFFLATELRRESEGGGVAGENIVVHEVPLAELGSFLRRREAEGCLISATLFAGLSLAGLTLGPPR